jgi:hypothetical protein
MRREHARFTRALPSLTMPFRNSDRRCAIAGILARLSAALCAGALVAGCATGPRDIQETRLHYNEVVKTTSEQQLLLNIVRLRYTDTPSSLTVANIAAQFELVKQLSMTPSSRASCLRPSRSMACYISPIPHGRSPRCSAFTWRT